MTTLRRMVQSGRVRIAGLAVRNIRQMVVDEKLVQFMDEPRRQPSPPRPKMKLEIVHEDEDIIVINKPSGLLTSTTPREKRPTVLAMVREHVAYRDPKAQLGLIHRLDADASGLIVFSKNHDAYLSLKRQFFDHNAKRVYLAMVHGTPNPKKGRIGSRLVERADGTVRSTDDPRKGELAISDFETLWSEDGRSLVRVDLQTGKKHQIRVHLAERGCPIVNDRLYGEEKGMESLLLSAFKLTIEHPKTGKLVTFEIDPPAEMRR